MYLKHGKRYQGRELQKGKMFFGRGVSRGGIILHGAFTGHGKGQGQCKKYARVQARRSFGMEDKCRARGNKGNSSCTEDREDAFLPDYEIESILLGMASY